MSVTARLRFGRHEEQSRRPVAGQERDARTGRAPGARRSPSRGRPPRPPWPPRPRAGRPRADRRTRGDRRDARPPGRAARPASTRLADAQSDAAHELRRGHRLGQLQARVLRRRGPRAPRRSRQVDVVGGGVVGARGQVRDLPGERPINHRAERYSSGSACCSACTGSNRSPSRSIRASTSSDVEAERRRIFELLPANRRGDRGPRSRPQRVHGHGRLVLVVLAPVDQHLALAQLLLLGRHDQLRVLPPPDGGRAPARAAWSRRRSPRRG